MRLICTIDPKDSQEDGIAFAYYLTSQGIENECQQILEEGRFQYRIWIYDEDAVTKATELYQIYKSSPQAACYVISSPPQQDKETGGEPPPVMSKKRSFLSAAPYGPITLFLIFSSIILFVWSQFSHEPRLPSLPGVIDAPSLSGVERALIFDDPPYLELRDKLYHLYPPSQIQAHQPPSEEAQELLYTLTTTPIWMGVYDRVVERLQHHNPPTTPSITDFMSDIRHGQLWRLFTPAILHFDFLHIFFNLLWLILLGNQIEYRIGSLRYSLFVLCVAVFSNLGQYIMSGPFFLGLSGIVCGMAAFIWARQRIAPWEGYLLHRFTLLFLALFVVGIFALQVLFFFLQVFSHMEFTVGIANTAHLVGAAVGYGFGRMRRLFSIQKKIES